MTAVPVADDGVSVPLRLPLRLDAVHFHRRHGLQRCVSADHAHRSVLAVSSLTSAATHLLHHHRRRVVGEGRGVNICNIY